MTPIYYINNYLSLDRDIVKTICGECKIYNRYKCLKCPLWQAMVGSFEKTFDTENLSGEQIFDELIKQANNKEKKSNGDLRYEFAGHKTF